MAENSTQLEQNSDTITEILNLTNSLPDANTLSLCWSNKKWAAVGDSLTQVAGTATEKYYHDYIAEKTGITVTNMGVGGSGYKKREDEEKAIYQRILSVPTDTDIVTIFGSGNDLSYIDAQTEWETVTPTWNSSKYIRNDTSGEVVDYTGNEQWQVSDLIDVNPGDILKFTAGIKFAKTVLVFYDINEAYVSRIASETEEQYVFTDKTVTVPNNAAYMRVGNVTYITTFTMQKMSIGTLGVSTDTGATTLCGCINTAIDNLYSILPTVQL